MLCVSRYYECDGKLKKAISIFPRTGEFLKVYSNEFFFNASFFFSLFIHTFFIVSVKKKKEEKMN